MARKKLAAEWAAILAVMNETNAKTACIYLLYSNVDVMEINQAVNESRRCGEINGQNGHWNIHKFLANSSEWRLHTWIQKGESGKKTVSFVCC